MEIEEILKNFDLTDSEIKIYLTLLRENSGTASFIAKKANAHRRLTYDNFQSLTEKGLVSYVDKKNKRIYKPVNPKRLKELIEDKREYLNELEKQVEKMLPSLISKYNSRHEKNREVKILEGKEGIKQLFNDELREGKEIYLIGTPKESENILKYFLISWTRKRKNKKMKIKGIFESDMKKSISKRKNIESKFLPEGYKSNVSISIYGKKIGIVFWIKDPLVIMIEDEEAAKSFMNYFKMVWKSANK